ncbi:MAG: hypothetical protein JWN72_753 [Thermoleophilia bacterium]|nr:hypothetical protein [Thermoleophilia bacterium]
MGLEGIIRGAGSVVAHLDDAGPRVVDDVANAATKGLTAADSATAFMPALSAADQAAAAKADLLADFMKHAVNGAARPSMSAPPASELVRGVKGIAKLVKERAARVDDAIHYVKNDGKFGGAERNPDVFFHKPTGDLYPVDARTGAAGPDSFGNLLEALRDMPARWPN